MFKKDLPKWQFCNTTHPPSFEPVYNAFYAAGPCPWPSDIVTTYYVRFPLYFASLKMVCKGSAPTESTKIKGILFVVSLKTIFIETESVLRKASPSVSWMYCVIAYKVASGFKSLVKINF